MESEGADMVNRCYEALLDLKCMFGYWSDLQSNFYYHWKKILNSSISFKNSENAVLKTYAAILQPVLKYAEPGVESNTALNVVRELDNYRKKEDETFEPYSLKEVLNRDAPSIKLPQRPSKPVMIRKKPQPAPKIVLTEDSSVSHSYGTRRSKMLSEGTAGVDGKAGTSGYGMGQHLKKGISSDYVWEFTGNELKDDFDE